MDNAIVFAKFGKLYKLTIKNTLELNDPVLLHDFNDYKFEELAAPY
jgi:hypothetical protein